MLIERGFSISQQFRTVAIVLATGMVALAAGASTKAFTVTDTYYVPVAARAAGAHESFTQTDLWLRNPGATAVSATIDLLPSGLGSGAVAPTASKDVDVPAGQSLAWDDVISSLFERETGVGALRVKASGELVIGSRTYNASDDGTYGELLGGVHEDDLLPANTPAHILLASKTDDFRTNLGLVNPGTGSVVVTVSLKTSTGGALVVGTLEVPGGGHAQVNDIFGAMGAPAYRDSRIELSAGQPFLAYASIVDNRTNDPTIELARSQMDAARELLLPAAARADGANGSSFYSDVRIFNFNSVPVVVDLTYWPRGGAPVTVPPAFLDPGVMLSLADVVGSVFFAPGTSGPVRISASSPILAGSRLFNKAVVGTSGQAIPAAAMADTIYAGAPVELAGLESSAAMRSNVGFVNASDRDVTLAAELVGANGATLGTKALTLGAGVSEQWNDVFAVMGAPAAAGATLKVATEAVGAVKASLSPIVGGVAIFASLVDNATGDPAYQDASVVVPASGIAIRKFRISPDAVCAAGAVDVIWEVVGGPDEVRLATSLGEDVVASSGKWSVGMPANGRFDLTAEKGSQIRSVRTTGRADQVPVIQAFEVQQKEPSCPGEPVLIHYQTTGAAAVYVVDEAFAHTRIPNSSPVDGVEVTAYEAGDLTLVAVSSCGADVDVDDVEVYKNFPPAIFVTADPAVLYYYRWSATTGGCCAVRAVPLTTTLTVVAQSPSGAPVETVTAEVLYGKLRAGGLKSAGPNRWTGTYEAPVEWLNDVVTVTATDACGQVSTASVAISVNICFPPEAGVGCACPTWCQTAPSALCAGNEGWCTQQDPVPLAAGCTYCFYPRPPDINHPYSCNE